MKQLILGLLVTISFFLVGTAHAASTSRLTIPLASNTTLVIKNVDNVQSHIATISDSLASTKVILSSDGTTNAAPKYYPYGHSISQLTQNPNNRYYTGQRKVTDVSSPIYNYNARYYSPDTGIFTQPDTVEGLNRFAYVSGNPIMHNDPTGHCIVCVNFNQKPGWYGGSRIEKDFKTTNVLRSSSNIVPRESSNSSQTSMQLAMLFMESSNVLETYFHANKFGTHESGASWVTTFEPRKKTSIEFSAQFSDNFDFGRGGKLHGLCNGPCPLGGKETGEFGMSSRFMWGAEGEMYLYVYDKNKLKGYQYGQYIPLFENPPELASNNDGSFRNVEKNNSFIAGYAEFYHGTADPLAEYKKIQAIRGNWYILRMEVALNDPDKKNGSIQAWMNGNRVANITGIDFIGNSHDANAYLTKAHFQTFAGGNDQSYAPKTDGYIRFGYFNVE